VTPEQIESAADTIAAHVRHTPVLEVSGSEFDIDATVALKLEHHQFSGTFKARGASHFMATKEIGPAGVVAASGGNHGAAVAWAAREFGHPAHIFVPTISAPAKVERLRSYGASVHQIGSVYAEALAAAEAFQTETGATPIHAYNDPVVVTGAGTCGFEFDRQSPGLDAVLVACGGGGLAGGLAAWFGTRTEIVVCETTGTMSYAAACEKGEPVDVEVSGIAADALGATRIGTVPWELLSGIGATALVVSDEELHEAQRRLWDQFRIVVEPSAAAPLAGLLSGRWTPPSTRIGLVICGANTAIGW
jgi:threonine dehydratase